MNTDRLKFWILLTILALAGAYVFIDFKEIENSLWLKNRSKVQRILFSADDRILANGMFLDQLQQFGEKKNVELEYYQISNWTSQEFLNKFDSLPLEKVDLVVLNFAIQDYIFRISLAQTMQNIKAILEKTKGRDLKCLFILGDSKLIGDNWIMTVKHTIEQYDGYMMSLHSADKWTFLENLESFDAQPITDEEGFRYARFLVDQLSSYL